MQNIEYIHGQAPDLSEFNLDDYGELLRFALDENSGVLKLNVNCPDVKFSLADLFGWSESDTYLCLFTFRGVSNVKETLLSQGEQFYRLTTAEWKRQLAAGYALKMWRIESTKDSNGLLWFHLEAEGLFFSFNYETCEFEKILNPDDSQYSTANIMDSH